MLGRLGSLSSVGNLITRAWGGWRRGRREWRWGGVGVRRFGLGMQGAWHSFYPRVINAIFGWAGNLPLVGDSVEWRDMVADKGSPPRRWRAVCGLDKVLAKKIRVVLLRTTVARPHCGAGLVSSLNWNHEKPFPRGFECRLHVGGSCSTAIPAIVHNLAKGNAICRNSLCDDRMNGEVDPGAVVHDENETFEVAPQ